MATDIQTYLAQSGQSVTSARLAVYAFLQHHDPTTTASVIAALSLDHNRASIYRTLGLFRELGVIQDIVAGGKRMIELTDAFDSHHHHLACLTCGRIQVIDDAQIEARLNEVAHKYGFEPAAHQIELSGRCSNCLQKSLPAL